MTTPTQIETPAANCEQSQSPLICTLIQAIELETYREQKQREAQVKQMIAAAKQAARTELKKLYDELEPLIVKSVYDTNNRGEFAWLRIELNAQNLLLLDLAPFFIFVERTAWNLNSSKGEWSVTLREEKQYQPVIMSADKAADFLYRMRQIILVDREAQRQQRIKDLLIKLNPDDARHAADAVKSDEILSALIALDPAQSEKYHAAHGQLLAAFAKWEDQRQRDAEDKAKRTAADKARTAAYVLLANAYQADFQSYWDSVVACRKYNIAEQKRFQAELDAQTFDVWELEYGILAEEDGERMVETRTAYLLNGYVQNNWGEYQVLQRGGDVVLRRFSYEVSKTAPATWIPSEHQKFARKIEVNGVTFYASPAHPYPADFAPRVTAAWKYHVDVAEPAVPEGLSWDNRGYCYGDDIYIYGTRAIQEDIKEANPLPIIPNSQSDY